MVVKRLGAYARLGLLVSVFCTFEAGSARSLDFQCPPDVYSPEYETYLSNIQKHLGFILEPQVYGEKQDILKLQADFRRLDVSSGGKGRVLFVFSDKALKRLYMASCDSCGMVAYQSLVSACSVQLGSQCIDFAVIIDDKAQCLITPRPEF